MTNGEKIKEIYPRVPAGVRLDVDGADGTVTFTTNKNWWNAEYEEPNTKNDCAEQNGCITCSLDDGDDCCRKLFEESMQEPTAKNNLAVDCISRKQAIDATWNLNLETSCDDEKVVEMLRKLPSVTPQPTKNNLADEYVSRKALMVILSDYYDTTVEYRAMLKEIAALPSVTPQATEKGRWLAIRTKDDTHNMTCSCCGHVVVELVRRRITEETALEYLKDRIDENKFCPNCGADMRG